MLAVLKDSDQKYVVARAEDLPSGSRLIVNIDDARSVCSTSRVVSTRC
jgi:hypothetical protein